MVDESVLYEYQKTGIAFLEEHPRAILGDDMGLGKTLQLIGLADRLEAKSVLVVCPNSLKLNWWREIGKWSPTSTTSVVDSFTGDRKTQLHANARFTIINYEVLHAHTCGEDKRGSHKTHDSELIRMTWDIVIFDEAHRIKNRDAAMTKAAKLIARRAKRLYHSTGTPITNRASELWALLNMIDPKGYSSYWRFCETYSRMINNGFGWEVIDVIDPTASDYFKTVMLQKDLKKWMIRRTKSEVFPDMPAKIIERIGVTLTGDQAKVYKAVEQDMLAGLTTSGEHIGDLEAYFEEHTSTEGALIAPPTVLAQITRLRQIAIDHRLPTGAVSMLQGAKVDVLLDILDSLEGKKVVIFSQFSSAIDALETTLHAKGFTSVKITGDVTGVNRDKAVQDFQTDPTVQLALCTIGAGGVGITLTAASTAIFLDKAWTPALNAQAQDRIHRIGQTEAVTIIELFAENSVELYIEKLLEKKTAVINDVVEGDAINRASAEISQIFGQ